MASLGVLESLLACKIDDELLTEYSTHRLAIGIDSASRLIRDIATLWEVRAVCRRLSRYEGSFYSIAMAAINFKTLEGFIFCYLDSSEELTRPTTKKNPKLAGNGLWTSAFPVCLWLHPTCNDLIFDRFPPRRRENRTDEGRTICTLHYPRP
jgi:hypothetical protein